MALEEQSSGRHNRMLGQRVKHPKSTNFDEDFPLPPAKRYKREETTDAASLLESGDDPNVDGDSPGIQYREILDSEADDENDDGGRPLGSQTELESALPPINSNQEAILAYEAAQAAGTGEALDLQGQLGKRQWTQGKSSIYVDAFNLALETVLEEEHHLFDEAEIGVFEAWRTLSYEAQFLYVRLFLRKTAAWHRINRLRYHGDIADIPAAIIELSASHTLPEVKEPPAPSSSDIYKPPADTVLSTQFTFADGSEKHITTLEEASSLLLLEELKSLSKDAKLQANTNAQLLKSLKSTSSKQSGLDFPGLQKIKKEDSIDSEDCKDRPANQEGHFFRRIMDDTGPCIRLSSAPLKLFERVHLVFYRSTEWTEKSLTTIILAQISRRNFPEYIVSRSANIFPSQALLLEFEASLRIQFRIDNILEFSGTPKRDGLQIVIDIFEELYSRWQALVKEEQRKEDSIYQTGEGAYLRRFSPAWVYTRVVHKGAFVLGRLHEHQREHGLLTELLSQHLFHAARRGAWYQRKALLEEHYMHALTPMPGLSDEVQKKHWKRVSLETCEEGLADKETHLIYHYDLQKRIMKLEKQLKTPKRQQHSFSHVSLSKPIERTFEGIRIERPPTLRRSNSSNPNLSNGRTSSPSISSTRRGAKTIWLDPTSPQDEVSVEAMCLSHYRTLGYKGYHSEGSIIRTLFGYLFFDILFQTYVPNVFQTAYQTCPLDLHTDAFFSSRETEINHRLAEISNGEAGHIIKEIWDRESEKATCVVGLDWSFPLEDLLEIIECFNDKPSPTSSTTAPPTTTAPSTTSSDPLGPLSHPGPDALSTILKTMAQEYQARGGGIPDLFLWHPSRKEICFAEVKSENDRLSDTQRLWIHVLSGAGVRVELCNARAGEVSVRG